ncbi:STAS domain-containing protein [Anaerolineales bacterium HSG6]|nr:STAS domain-containing protein [Anaerolineales bacterium HSG6]
MNKNPKTLKEALQRISELESDIASRSNLENSQQTILDTVLKNVPFGVFMVDVPSGKPILVNEQAINILGKGIVPSADKDQLGEVYQAYVYGTNQLYPTEKMPLIQGMQGNSSTIDDMEIHHGYDKKILLEVTGAPLYNSEGDITASMAVFYDITDRKQTEIKQEHLQQEIIEAQQMAIQELSTPIIPIMDRIIVIPLIGSIDSLRAKDLMRTMLQGISDHRAKVIILDITGVAVVDTGVAAHLDKTIQAARLKGARTILTGISDAVAETIIDLGIDWSNVETLRDLQTGLMVALQSLGLTLRNRN